MSGMDRWEVRRDLYEDVEVEAEDRLRAIIAAAKVWGVRWLPIAQECRTKKVTGGGQLWRGLNSLRSLAASAASL